MEEVAQVYARSLFQVAAEKDRTDEIREQLGQLAGAMEEDRDLQVFFFSPYFSTKEKKEGLDKTISGADEIFVNFLKVLIENHRMPVIFRVRREYEVLWEEANRLLPVSVTSAVELDEATVSELRDRIAEQTGRRVEMSTHVDADILGGIVVRVGNSVLDASVRNRLDQLRRNVARAA
ncbi:MAG TPA: ATP synthase F1 subunit delta [Gaiellaceae bacterium]|nr:ATP synthase F1 subunit delta [Gaiellaceae bacterium]